MIEGQELYCHNCNGYVQFPIDLEMNGRHVITCPNCGHEHYRIVENGIITEERWWSSNGLPTITITSASWSTTSSYTTYNSGSYSISYGQYLNYFVTSGAST